MGITRIRRVKAHKKKEIERAVKWIVYPPAVALLGTGKKKRRKRK